MNTDKNRSILFYQAQTYFIFGGAYANLYFQGEARQPKKYPIICLPCEILD